MSADRSISARLERAKSPSAMRAVLTDWHEAWRAEQAGLIGHLEQAVRHRDFDRQASLTGALKEMSRKRFVALANVLRICAEKVANE